MVSGTNLFFAEVKYCAPHCPVRLAENMRLPGNKSFNVKYQGVFMFRNVFAYDRTMHVLFLANVNNSSKKAWQVQCEWGFLITMNIHQDIPWRTYVNRLQPTLFKLWYSCSYPHTVIFV